MTGISISISCSQKGRKIRRVQTVYKFQPAIIANNTLFGSIQPHILGNTLKSFFSTKW